MEKINHANLLKEALQGTGFVRRGSAFFRVWGDGVLQVLKFERERVFQAYDLSIGIFSMYGRLYPQWFTSGGCIPRGSVANFVGLRFVDGFLPPDSFTKSSNEEFFYEGFPVTVDPDQRLWNQDGEHWKYFFTAEQQLNILTEKVLPWLNAITTQSLAAEAMYKICPIPNDDLRFDAHLAAGELPQAEEVMSAILKQHADARARWEQTFAPDQFAEMAARLETEDIPLWAALKMVQNRNKETISQYLRENYKVNCGSAKFCMK
jgi:hypothetical protein